MIAGVIHVPACPGRRTFAQASITARNAVSTRISNVCCFTRLRSERAMRNSSTNSTIRGSGLHQRTGWSPLYHGKDAPPVGVEQALAA